MRILIPALLGCFCIITSAAAEEALSSPDGTLVLTVTEGRALEVSLTVDGEPALAPSPLSITIDGTRYGPKAVLGTPRHRSVDESVRPVIREKAAVIRDQYNEMTVPLTDDVALEFRAYDNGVAWRWVTSFDGRIIVDEEEAALRFKEDSEVWFPHEDDFISHNERLYEKGSIAPLRQKDLASLPLLIETAPANLLLTETDLRDYAGMWITGGRGATLAATFPRAVKTEHMADDRNPVVDERHNYLAETEGTRRFPWRILGVAREDKDLLSNQLAWLLAPELELAETDWIRPGQVAWDWWNMSNLFGVDFRAGINTETYRYFIDFAAANGIDYVIFDEGWYELGDIMAVNPDIDVPGLISYAAEKDVDIILWAIWHTLDEKLDEALDQFAEWGAAGIKVDFMQRDDQWMVDYYWRIAKAAAKRELLVDYHGAHKPAGLRRAYPNVISYEGVKGLENLKWSEKPDPDHNTTLPFIRMVAGPMDYTPGAMVNIKADEFTPMFSRPMSISTRVHQLALYIVFESPLQMLADSPSRLAREQESVDFITSVPTVWDETVPLAGKVGDYAAIARRSGDEWFIGAITDENARELDIPLDFLGDGGWRMISFRDGINADRYASDYKAQELTFTDLETITVNLAPGGGFAARLIPAGDTHE